MNIAVLLPVKGSASDGLLKHINCIYREWALFEDEITLTIYLPEGLNILESSLNANITHFPSNDFWFGFKRLSALVAAGKHDVALVLIARHVALGSLPVVTMVQNVEPIQRIDYATSFKWRLRLWALRREQKHSCRNSTRVLVTTQYVKRCLVENLGVNSDRIDVLPFGIHSSEVNNLGTPPSEIKDLTPGSYIFTAGSMVPYRGMEDLVFAYRSLLNHRDDVPLLVIAGEDKTDYGRSIKSLAEKLDVSHCFRWLGQISHDQMNWCYKQCRAFVLTTRAESFCNIALEAMGNGCACIICDHEPMPEVCGDAPIYYKWGDAKALAERLIQLIDADDHEINKLKDRARFHSTNYSWPEIAVGTLSVLKKAIHY